MIITPGREYVRGSCRNPRLAGSVVRPRAASAGEESAFRTGTGADDGSVVLQTRVRDQDQWMRHGLAG